MKMLQYFSTVLFTMCILCTSCKKEGLITYDTENSIYFHNQLSDDVFADSTGDIVFAYMDAAATDSVVKVALRVTGFSSSKERKFVVVADAASTATEGIHYEKLPAFYTMPPHVIDDTITIRLFRTDDLKDKRVTLVLRLEPTTDFATHFAVQGNHTDGSPISYVKYSISFSDVLAKPLGWYYTFGKFSPKKMDIICDLGSVSALWLNAGDADFPLGSRPFNLRCTYLTQLLRNYLLQQSNAGTPVYYEDGVTLMATND